MHPLRFDHMPALGEEFRSAREARGLTLSDVAEQIHIRSVYLHAIETEEWPAIGVIEIDQRLVEHAAELAIDLDLRSLDALHLAAALVLPRDDLVLATWDRRLHAAAHTTALPLLPETII